MFRFGSHFLLFFSTFLDRSTKLPTGYLPPLPRPAHYILSLQGIPTIATSIFTSEASLCVINKLKRFGVGGGPKGIETWFADGSAIYRLALDYCTVQTTHKVRVPACFSIPLTGKRASTS